MSAVSKPSQIKLGTVNVTLPNPAIQISELEDGWLILFEWTGLAKEFYARNVRMYDQSGNMIWEIQEGPNTSDGPSPWAGIHCSKLNDQWRVDTSDSIFYELDIETGRTKFLFNSK